MIFQEKAFEHSIQLSSETDGIPETINADQRKLKQILYNLLSNAVKFTPDGGEIRLTANLTDGSSLIADINKKNASAQGLSDVRPVHNDAKKFVQISVRDTGIGLRKEDLARVFSPFEQVEDSRSRRFQGTGLGLSLTKRFVELHGGWIWVESKGNGKGSTFKFVIPA